MKNIAFTALLLAGSAIALPANAATIVTVQGNFGGIFEGSPFSPQAAVFTGLGGNATTISFGGTNYTGYLLSSLTSLSTLGGVSSTFDFGSGFFYYTGASVSGFAKGVGQNLFTVSGSNVVLGSDAPFQTSLGSVSITSGQGITSTLAAVPEPSTWAMMLIGFGALGFAMRRRQSNVTTRVRFA